MDQADVRGAQVAFQDPDLDWIVGLRGIKPRDRGRQRAAQIVSEVQIEIVDLDSDGIWRVCNVLRIKISGNGDDRRDVKMTEHRLGIGWRGAPGDKRLRVLEGLCQALCLGARVEHDQCHRVTADRLRRDDNDHDEAHRGQHGRGDRTRPTEPDCDVLATDSQHRAEYAHAIVPRRRTSPAAPIARIENPTSTSRSVVSDGCAVR